MAKPAATEPSGRTVQPSPVNLKRATHILATMAMGLVLAGCGSSSSSTPPATPTPTPAPTPAPASALAATFSENPVPFRSTGCNASAPQGWYTTARLQETGGVAFTPSALVQKLDGNVASFLTESFNSRFGACTGSPFNQGVIPANGAACGSVGICTSGTFNTYQFQLTGTDANGRSMTFDSPMLQLGARPAGQSIRLSESSVMPTVLAPIPPGS
jgi:hypothetical protein